MNAQTIAPVIETSIAEYSQTAAALSDLNQRYRGVVYDVTTTKGMDAAKRGRQEIKGYRTALENKRKEIKAPALELCRSIDSEAQRITVMLVELEDPIDSTIKAEEAKKEAERWVKIEAERVRISELKNNISALANFPLTLMGATSEAMLTELQAIRLLNTCPLSFSEFSDQATEAKQKAVKTIEAMLSSQLVYESGQRKIVAERAELARLRAEQDQRDKEQREREAVERQKIEAERRAAAEMIAEVQRKAKSQQDELDRQAQALRDEQDRVAREERAREKAEADASRAKIEAAERAARVEVNEKMAAEEMLRTFLEKYGAKKEFAYIAFAINQYFD